MDISIQWTGVFNYREENQASKTKDYFFGDSQHIEEIEAMPNIDEVYVSTSNALKAEDLRGNEVKVIISGSEMKQFDNGKKIILSFKDKEKTLVLNKTNARKIGDKFGNNTDDWNGKEIILYPDKTEFQGKLVDCIRVRPSLPVADFDDDIPF